MQTKRDTSQPVMMLLPALEEMVPQNYYLRRLNKVLDISFVHEVVRPYYCQVNGRPSIDPEVVLRLFLLQAITGTASVRELLREAELHLGYRWFIGYGATESLPDHSTLSKALDRFGDDVFNRIFQHSILLCKNSGLIEGKILHLDATTIRADLDKESKVPSDARDTDARFGRFPGNLKLPGYKQQTVADDKSRVILAIEVLPADVMEGSGIFDVVDEAIEHLDSSPEALCADGAYGHGGNRAACEERGVRLVSPPAKGHNHLSKEQFTIDRFEYDEDADVFTCPAGKLLHKKGPGGSKPNRWKYLASARDCKVCPLKEQCTSSTQRGLNAGTHHGALVRLRADSKTPEFKRLYKRRCSVIEGIFGEAKEWHGLRRAWRRGMDNMRVQCLLIASVLNFKRLIEV